MKESHVKEPFYIFLFDMKEMSEFCEYGNSVKIYALNIFYSYVQHFTLFNHYWSIRILVIVPECPTKQSEDFTTP